MDDPEEDDNMDAILHKKLWRVKTSLEKFAKEVSGLQHQ
jgi:hypothetical protein